MSDKLKLVETWRQTIKEALIKVRLKNSICSPRFGRGWGLIRAFFSLSPGYDKLKLVGHQLSDSPYFAAVELVIDFQSRIREAMALCE